MAFEEIAPVRPEDMEKLKFNHQVVTSPYVADRFSYTRRKTREVRVGDLGIGGNNPIRVQSMTISDTQDIAATVDEAEKLAQAGCELVRITAPSQKDAECLKDIRAQLFKRGCKVPLCADIHFTPNAAMLACEYVEKVRVNPGNFADKKVFAQREYTDSQYQEELERIEEKFSPLVKRAKELGRVLRIGTNHGSLSDRIMNRYGDTPRGMVESAIEFVDIARLQNFHDMVISMKASNPKVMIQAYRLLCARFDELGYDYPLHLGVTEAGAGEDGRLKSAVGIGSLLEDGIGDTIRVSLTEDSIHEIPVAYDLVRRFNPRQGETFLAGPLPKLRQDRALVAEPERSPYEYVRRSTDPITRSSLNLGGEEVTRVQVAMSQWQGNLDEVKILLGLDVHFQGTNDPLVLKGRTHTEILEIPVDQGAKAADFQALRAFLTSLRLLDYPVALAFRLPVMDEKFLAVTNQEDWVVVPVPKIDQENLWLQSVTTFLKKASGLGLQWLLADAHLPNWAVEKWGDGPEGYAQLQLRLTQLSKEMGVTDLLPGFESANPVSCTRLLAHYFQQVSLRVPIALREPKPCPLTSDDLRTATVVGSLLCDGIGDILVLEARERTPFARVRLAYNCLQATGNRITKTEFISCPSCGRTLFNLQETTERIRSKMGHLKGLKLAIMGCIVNGPGEMADAHFGYVGAGPGRINLYVGKELVQKNIPQSEADDRLIQLVRDHGMWAEPPVA